MGSLRQRLISKPLIKWYAGLLPEMSDTESQAIKAGTVWWDRDLMSGKPDWETFSGFDKPTLSEAEQAFLDGPVHALCAMLDDWEIEHERQNLPKPVWDFMVAQGFFAMIIPEDYGGKGFSAWVHSEVVRMIATRSITAAVTVMVPNSLGPGELLMLYGTKEQKDHYLPRLATGEDIPCFALTGIEAGSDASAMTDTGVVVEREVDGEKQLGIEITCDKRYITLAPRATIAGLAFKLRDPHGLIGNRREPGITLALVPTDTPGLDTGRRHYPAGLAFLNGPVRGENVFVPIDAILGGQEQVGQGWKMLMGALAAGRGISLPSLSAAGAALAARSTGAYARIREQFGLPVSKFEGVREPLARIAGTAYLLDGARMLTSIGIDKGEKPAVISAIMKYHATERLRASINDAMDVHGGKAICQGPKNYLFTAYKSIPVGITVEGANILTRSLIIFGQGSIRCHPWLLKEMQAVHNDDRDQGLKDFDEALFGHLGHQLSNAWRSVFHGLTGKRFAAAPAGTAVADHYKALSHASAQLAITTEISLSVLGGALKRKEALSARLGDVLSELYLLSGALKRFELDGCPEEDRPVLDWCFKDGLYTIDRRLREVHRHFPNPFWRLILGTLLFPAGLPHREPPSDDLMNEVAELITAPGPTRERIGRNVYLGEVGQPLADLEDAFTRVLRRDELLSRLKSRGRDADETTMQSAFTGAELEEIRQANQAVRRIVMVDDFDAEQLTGKEQSQEPDHQQTPSSHS